MHGWIEDVLVAIIALCQSCGIVEVEDGHREWAQALAEAHAKCRAGGAREDGRDNGTQGMSPFDFFLAYK